MINVYAVPKGAAECSHISRHVYNFAPITREDGELHLQFTNLYDGQLSSAFLFSF